MEVFFRRFSILLFSIALAGVAVLWVSDALHGLRPDPSHQRIGAAPLILIGLAYASFQLCGRRRTAERAKGLLLGLAFVIWGSEQLLPQSAWVTLMDNLVITVFVVDLALIIIEHLRRKDRDLP